jgi:hypothetical protein
MTPAAVQSQLVTLEDLPEIAERYARNYSTVAEYHEAQDAAINNNASKHIEAGREPYLVRRDAIEFGVHPYITVYDVMRERQDGLVGIATNHQTYFLQPNTILAWR